MSARLRDSFVTPPASVSSGFLSAEPAPSSGQPRAPLQPLGFGPSLLPHRTSARRHHLRLLRWRDVWRESERWPSTGGWFPVLPPTIVCRFDRLPFAPCRRDCARIKSTQGKARAWFIHSRPQS